MITILTMGSRGDTQPYIALGQALKKAGQRVRVAAFENYASFVMDHGLEFYPIKGDVSLVAASIGAQGAIKADNPLKVLLSFNQLKSYVFDLQKDIFEACVGSDAIVYHPGAALGYFSAQHFQIPSILATPFPMTPTKAYPALIFYDKARLGKRFNYLTHKAFEQIMWFASGGAVKAFLRQEFGRVPAGFGCPYPRQTTRYSPTVISCSSHVFPRPADWPAHVHSDGYWFLEDDETWQPPVGLVDFLNSGPPPVYIGFGSISDPQSAAKTTSLVSAALQHAGQRGILATGWQGMAAVDQLPEHIYMLESVPHTWLFPRMAAVVHHGGAGTTAAGLRAGVPSIIIPHGNDQFAWGRRVYELGVGVKPIPRKDLTAEKLADAIRFAQRDEILAAARDLGERIRCENGAEKAAQVIIGSLA